MKQQLFPICLYLGFGIAFLFYIMDLSLVSCDLVDDIKDNVEDVVFTNHCSKDLGCFYTGPPFFKLPERPISLDPELDLNCEFQLFTPRNPGRKYSLEMTEQSLRKSNFDSSLPTKIIVHGYIVDINNYDFLDILKKVLLKLRKYNVFILNWTKYSKPPIEQAIANTRSVGALLGNFINFLINNTGAEAKDVHLIGHSLGAHLSGHAGERVKNLGRITGLDPAGNDFDTKNREVRLDKTDADFVDVIHTSATRDVLIGYGITRTCGHQDFYVNGGTYQPGCDVISRVEEKVLKEGKNSSERDTPASCRHNRAWDLYIESIDQPRCHFQGVLCDSYEDYTSGKCKDNDVATMGFFAKPIPSLPKRTHFYLETTDHFPFCIS